MSEQEHPLAGLQPLAALFDRGPTTASALGLPRQQLEAYLLTGLIGYDKARREGGEPVFFLKPSGHALLQRVGLIDGRDPTKSSAEPAPAPKRSRIAETLRVLRPHLAVFGRNRVLKRVHRT